MVLGSWLTDAPQARRAQRLWGESQLGFQRGPWRCVLLVKLLDLSVLSFRPFIAWSQVPREDGAQRLPHASWFKASPWGGGVLVLFSGEILLCASVSSSLWGDSVAWWLGTRALGSENLRP